MSKRRDPLPRLNIASNLNSQQPMGGLQQGLYSPALPTSIQQSFHPSFPMNNPLQTPMQSFFTGAPGASGRPAHHAHQASLQLAAAGILPPSFATPVTSHFPRPSMMLGPGGQPQASSHPYPGRNRRQLSIGGPPKAVLGGPARKVSPLPGATGPSIAPAATTPAPTKTRKIIVNLPKESPVGEDGDPATRPEWARSPLANTVAYEDIPVTPAEIATAELYPPDSYRLNLPNSIDVYLPGKLAWDTIKQRDIEEKLEKLGVERGSGSSLPHIHAPHARAASISSPADPALLLFKLNKLQKAQDASSANNSLSVSPQIPFVSPFGLSPSPRAQLFGNRHGHSMSLAQGPSYQPYSSSPSPFNPFGVNAVLGNDSITESTGSASPFQSDPIHAPQGRIPVNFGPPLSASSSIASHVDFSRGFGLDVTLESEEEGAEQDHVESISPDEDNNPPDIDLDEKIEGDQEIDDGTTTAPQSRLHSRHVSKLSAALSLRSVGGNFQNQYQIAADRVEQEEREAEADQSEADVEEERPQGRAQDLDPVEEWTGSEDVYLDAETSEDESIGEWSNPSDEERARQQRVERRMRRRARQDVDQPRRLPNFPRPPESSLSFLKRREDDIISNPSEENLALARRAEFLGVTTEEFYPEANAPRMPQPNPFALPSHSRGASSQYSVHDPAMAHSRGSSDNYSYPTSDPNQHHLTLSAARRESLNPFAKPFVFGQRPPNSNAWPPIYNSSDSAAPSMPVPVPTGAASFSPTHTRLPSLGKPLNVTAPEFKPGGFNIAAAEFKPGSFNFRLPGAPQMPVVESAAPSFPISQHEAQYEDEASVESTPFKVQGREKRQRRLSSTSSIEEGDSMSSFKFPMKLDTSSPNLLRRRRSRSLSSTQEIDLDIAAEPFTFAGFSVVANNMPWMPQESDAVDADNAEDVLNDSSTTKGENSEVQGDEEIVIPAPTKQKRAPIPLDFKHPVSGNTVPAGLFKALISSNEDRTRRSVRSRLDSREIFEHSHRPSMDDDNVALISQKNPRSRLVTDPGERPTPSDVFGIIQHERRRSSLPDALIDNDPSPTRTTLSPQDLTSRLSLHHLEAVVGELLDEKFGELRSQLSRREQKSESAALAKAEEVVSLFRTQLQESAVQSLEDSQIDGRGEFDFQMLKEIVNDGNKELLLSFQQEIRNAIQNLPVPSESKPDILPVVEELRGKVVSAVVDSISDISTRHARKSPVPEQSVIVDKIVAALTPLIHSLRTEPIDYDFLTSQLTQSVKPHISQLIDLTSDKRETAGLILESILPHLATLKPVPVDSDAITTQLVTEVRRAIAPIDAFEIKEQVADLVIERLDSRLAVREKANSADIIASKVADGFRPLFDTFNKVPAAVGELASAQKTVDQKQNGLADVQSQILASVSEILRKIEPQFEQVKGLQTNVLKKLDQPTQSGQPDANILAIKDVVASLSSEQKKLTVQSEGVITESKVISDKLAALPEHFATIAKSVESSLTELITSRDNTKRELEELRKLNTEYQVQLTKARGSHGQVRVEKDVLAEKLTVLEADRDRLRAQTKELQTDASTKATETTALEARNAELEDALAKALTRLQSADVGAQSNQRSIADLEASNKGLTAEKQELKSKLDSLDRELRFAFAEKETASSTLAGLQAKYDVLASQQSNWEALNAATEKINMVFNLLENADSEEQKELRHYRDHSKVLEDENTTLHKRIKDMESRLANSERSAATVRQTLSQAQQRSEEWERLAKAAQGTVEMLETQLEQAEQTQSQLDADYQLAKMQLDERDADSRLKQDRETKLQQQVTALESKCVRLQNELEKANAAKLSSTAVPFRPRTNGNTLSHPSRPDSRSSAIYDGRDTPNRRIASYSSTRSSVVTPPNGTEPSVWDSMHAPTNSTARWVQAPLQTPVSRYSSLAPGTPKASPYVPYPRGPSPTPSTVSAVPTQGDDGWWS